MKVGDLVRCTGGNTKEQSLGVIIRITQDKTFKVFFFNPPHKRWSAGVWTKRAIKKVINESR